MDGFGTNMKPGGAVIASPALSAGGVEYLVDGAALVCMNGGDVVNLKVTEGHSYTSGGKKKANCKDCKEIDNIPYFGTCSLNQCDYKCEGYMELEEEWINIPISSTQEETVSGEDAISLTSILMCKKGGVIIPATSGQGFNEEIDWDAFEERYAGIYRWMAGIESSDVVYEKDPINMNTGNYIYEKEDLLMDGVMPVSFKLYYNAMDCGKQYGLPEGWSHNFGVRLWQAVRKHLIGIVLEDGREVLYRRMPDGSYTAVMGDTDTVKQSGAGHVYERENGLVYRFDKDGHLCRQEDRQGNYRIFTYNDKGLLESVENSAGFGLHYSYNQEGMLLSVWDDSGRKIHFGYRYGKLRRLTDSDGGTYIYEYNEAGVLYQVITPREVVSVKNEYDGANRVIEQTQPNGGVVELRYDDKKNRTYMKEQNGNLVIYESDKRMRNIRTIYADGEETFAYNDRNQRVRHTDKNGNTTHYAYDDRGNITQIIDPLGHKTNLTYDGKGRLTVTKWPDGSCTKRCYDINGNLTEITDENGNLTRIFYNAKGLQKTIVRPDDSEIHFEYDERGNISCIRDASGSRTCYEYDALNRPMMIKDANGHVTKYKFDGNGNITELENALGDRRIFLYDRKLVKKIIDFDGTAVEMEYNEMNRVSRYTDGGGNSTYFEYDLMGNLIRETLPCGGSVQYVYNKLNRLETVIDAAGGVTKYEYDGNGNIIRVTEPCGGETKLAYDALNRLVSVEDADGAVTKYSYDLRGNITETIDGLGRKTEFAYDNCGNLVRRKEPSGGETVFTYNALNQVTDITKPSGETLFLDYQKGGRIKEMRYSGGKLQRYRYDAAGNITGMENENGFLTEYHYDALNRVTKIHTGDGAESVFTYDATDHITSFLDAHKNLTRFEYSSTGQLVRVIDALNHMTGYTYDAEGNLLSILRDEAPDFALEDGKVEDAIKDEMRFQIYERDQAGRITKIINARGQEDRFAYDRSGRLICRTDKAGNQTKLSYTLSGNLQSVLYADGKRAEYSYNPLDQLTEIRDWLGMTTFVYDNCGRILSVTDPAGRVVSYEWDVDGNAAGQTDIIHYPDGMSVKYEYDRNKNLVRLLSEAGNVRYVYDEKGRLIQKDFSDGISASYVYDVQNRLSDLVYSEGNEPLDEYHYEYDFAGNKEKIRKYRKGFPEDSGTFTYKYDALNRVDAVYRNQEKVCAYQYDAFGNRIYRKESGKEVSYAYDVLDRLTEEQGDGISRKYQYDTRGNLSAVTDESGALYRYEFGADNRLAACNGPLGKSTYQYNGRGLRVGKTEEAKGHGRRQIVYVLDQMKMFNNLLQKTEDDSVRQYIWDDTVLFGQSENVNHHYLTDEMGSSIRMFEYNACRGNMTGYDAFGRTSEKQSVYEQDFSYIGYTKDKFSGTDFAQAREYLPSCGRFVSEDPIPGMLLYPLSVNRYLYCNDDPLNTKDETGLIAPLLVAALVGGVVGVVGQAISDGIEYATTGEITSTPADYVGAFAGGAVGGMLTPFVSPVGAAFADGAVSSLVSDGLNYAFYRDTFDKSLYDVLSDGLIQGGVTMIGGRFVPSTKVPGFSAGRNSFAAINKQMMTKYGNGTINDIKLKTMYKMMAGASVEEWDRNVFEGLMDRVLSIE